MEILFESNIKIDQAESLLNTSNIRSFLRGNGVTDNDFKVLKIHQKVQELDKSAGSGLVVDVFDFFGIDPSECSFVHLQVFNQDSENYSLNDIRFTLTLAGVDIGDHSQFTLTNCNQFTSTIVVNGVTIPDIVGVTGRKAIFVLIVGSK